MSDSFTINFVPLEGRHCGSCTLCCTLVPVGELRKPANTRCEHQFSKGCRIYPSRPPSCRAWNCAWLTDPTTLHLRRPDKVGYVIDSMPDYPTTVEDGVQQTIVVSQIWVSAKTPEIWRHDRQLFKWIKASGRPAIVRVGNARATMVVPPALMQDREWGFMPVELTRPEDLSWADETSEINNPREPQRAGSLDQAVAVPRPDPSGPRLARISQRVK